MGEEAINIVIGGETGQGLVTVGEFLSRALVRAGYAIVVTQDYMSRIRGGHNSAERGCRRRGNDGALEQPDPRERGEPCTVT